MSQQTRGIMHLLSFSCVYSMFQDLLGARKARERFVAEYVRPAPGATVVDVGCGPGAIVEFLPSSVHYVGLDRNPNYIRAATARFGDRARFVCMDANQIDALLADIQPVDIALLLAVLHHLSDEQAKTLMGRLAASLKAEGLLVSVDPGHTAGQHPIGRLLIRLDRGRNIRQPEEYRKLAAPFFGDIHIDVRHDLLRVPYTHAILRARGPGAGNRTVDSGPPS